MPVGFPDYYGGLTLPVTVEEGGTGQTSVTSKALLYGAGTSKLIETNVGTTGQYLQIDSTTLDPTFKDLSVDVSVITGILPIAHGGTGSSAPALVEGTGITITGTWPNQTITNSSNYASLADPLPIAHGGTGSSSPALVEGTGITITGTWPNNTITNSSAYAALADPLPVAHGGTGSSSPALVEGTNISITGTWPGQTIALVDKPSITQLSVFGFGNESIIFTADGQTNHTHLDIYGNFVASTNYGTDASYNIYDSTGATPLSVNLGGTGETTLNKLLCTKVTKYNSVSTAGVGMASIVAVADKTGQTASVAQTTLLTPTSAAAYRVNHSLYLTSLESKSITVTAKIRWTQNTEPFTDQTVFVTENPGTGQSSDALIIYPDSGTAISYELVLSLTGTTVSFDYHLRLEAI